MNIIRIFRLGMRVYEWATPHVQEWHRARHFHRTEGQRHLKARNWTEAEAHLASALAERKHSTKQRTELLLGLASAQQGQGKLSEAEQTAREAVEAGVSAGLHHRQMEALDVLLEAQSAQGNHAAAQNTAELLLRKEGTRRKSDPARMASVSRKLGRALAQSGNGAEALAAFERSVKFAEAAHGPEHMETAASLSELGAQYRALGDHAGAERNLRRAVEIYRATGGFDSHEATQGVYELAVTLLESGDPDGACNEFERVLAIKERLVGGKPEDTADAQVNLARIYIQAGRTSAARELLLRAIGVLDRSGSDELLSAALELMVDAELQAGREGEAERWHRKLGMVGQERVPPDVMAQFGRQGAAEARC